MREYHHLHFPAEAVIVEPALLSRLPPSARQVFDALRHYGPLSHSELAERTGIPSRTIRFAVKRLKDHGLVDLRSSLHDCRTSYFFIDPRCVRRDVVEQIRRDAREHTPEGVTLLAV